MDLIFFSRDQGPDKFKMGTDRCGLFKFDLIFGNIKKITLTRHMFDQKLGYDLIAKRIT